MTTFFLVMAMACSPSSSANHDDVQELEGVARPLDTGDAARGLDTGDAIAEGVTRTDPTATQ